jgi:hypothetical protein
LQEAEALCFRTRVLQAAVNFVAFLETSGVPGDAVPSRALGEWYKATYKALKVESTDDFLFDPSVLVVGIIQEFVGTVRRVNRLDIASKSILIPLAFARTWITDFRDEVKKDDGVLVRLIDVSSNTHM